MSLKTIADSLVAAADRAYRQGGQFPARQLDRGLQLQLERDGAWYQLRAWRAAGLPADAELEKLDQAFGLPLSAVWVRQDHGYAVDWPAPGAGRVVSSPIVPRASTSGLALADPWGGEIAADDLWLDAQTWAYFQALRAGRPERIALVAGILQHAPAAWWDRFVADAAALLQLGGTNADRCRCVLRARSWIKE